MGKYLLILLIVVVLVAGVIAGIVLVQQRQNLSQKASPLTGAASVSLQPLQASFDRNTPYPVSVFFNTGGTAISTISVRLTFSNLGVTASGIQVSSSLLSSGDWTCPVKSITSVGSTGQIDIKCLNTSDAGFSSTANTLLGTFNLTADQVPVQNPLIVSFDAASTSMTQKSDASQVVVNLDGTGSYTITGGIAGSPTPTPILIVSSPTPTPLGTLLAQATSSPTPTATASSSAFPTPTSTTSATGSGSLATNPPIPVTGFDIPTIMGLVGGGILLSLGALMLIL